MKLVPCRGCKQPVARNARICPGCGARAPGRSRKWAILSMGLFFAMIVLAVYLASGDS